MQSDIGLLPAAAAAGKSRPLRSVYHRRLGFFLAVIPTLILRDLDRRFRQGNIAGLMLILEPLMMLGAIAVIQYVVRAGVSVYGPSMALFLVTGFLPFYLFVHSSRGLSKDITGEREYPIVNDFDIQIARLMIEISRNFCLSVVLLTAIYNFDTADAYPYDLGTVLTALGVVVMLALGLGLITSAIITVFPAWQYANGLVSRCFFFGSGVFSITDHMPPQIKDIVVWNPLCHCLMWVRTGFYRDYPHYMLDRGYAVEVAVAFLFVGFATFAARPRENAE